jgi:hypothetical protein
MNFLMFKDSYPLSAGSIKPYVRFVLVVDCRDVHHLADAVLVVWEILGSRNVLSIIMFLI